MASSAVAAWPRPAILSQNGLPVHNFNLFVFLIFAAIAGLVYEVLSRGLTPNSSFLDFVVVVGAIFLTFVIFMLIFVAISFRRMSNPLDDLVDASSKVAEGDYTSTCRRKRAALACAH